MKSPLLIIAGIGPCVVVISIFLATATSPVTAAKFLVLAAFVYAFLIIMTVIAHGQSEYDSTLADDEPRGAEEHAKKTVLAARRLGDLVRERLGWRGVVLDDPR